MIRNRTTLTAAALVLALSACTGKESNAGTTSPSSPSLSEKAAAQVDKAKEKAAEMKADLAGKSVEYTQVAEQKLAKLDTRLAELRKSASEATGDAKAEMEKLYANLAEERKAVGAKLGELKDTSADAWSSFTQKLDSSMHSLEQSVEKAFAKKP